MKNTFILLIVVVLALGDSASSFTTLLNQKAKCSFATSSGTALAGWFDAKPTNTGGGGTTRGNTKNDDMFEAQQEMLRARRGELSKDEVKEKKVMKKAKADAKTKALDKAAGTGKQDAAMYADEGEQETKFKFPWQN
jgi:hypothetical protein